MIRILAKRHGGTIVPRGAINGPESVFGQLHADLRREISVNLHILPGPEYNSYTLSAHVR
jgi:hypothetical protein